jgi:RNA recognition motif-containing protein
MDTKLYVGNLPYTTTEDDLRTLFAGAGTVVSVALIKDRDTGRSKGFGFVEMGSQSEAENAIKQFNGASFGERVLKVNIARPVEDRSTSRYSNSGRSGQRSSGYSDRNRRSGGGGGQRRY